MHSSNSRFSLTTETRLEFGPLFFLTEEENNALCFHMAIYQIVSSYQHQNQLHPKGFGPVLIKQ